MTYRQFKELLLLSGIPRKTVYVLTINQIDYAMKKYFIIIMILSSAITWVACSKSNDGGLGGSGGGSNNCTTAKSFSSDVNPIIQSTCAVSGCHEAGSINGVGPLTTHQQIFAARAQIKTAVNNGTMPKNGSLTPTQKNNILCWIDAGAPNN